MWKGWVDYTQMGVVLKVMVGLKGGEPNSSPGVKRGKEVFRGPLLLGWVGAGEWVFGQGGKAL